MARFLKRALAVAMLIALSTLGTYSVAQDGPPDLEKIKTQGYIIIAMNKSDSAPFYSQKDGQLVGIDVDIAKSIAAALGVEPRFDRSAKSFDKVVEMVRDGQADIGLSKLSRTAERARIVAFSNPYVILRHALLFNRLALAQKSEGVDVAEYVREFDGTLGVIDKSAYANFAKVYFPNAKVIALKDWNAVIEAARNRTIDAGYRDEFAVRAVAFDNPETSIDLRSITINDARSAISVVAAWDKPMLMAIINQAIDDRSSKMTADDVMRIYRESIKVEGDQ